MLKIVRSCSVALIGSALGLTLSGCAAIGGPSVSGTLSENLALVDLGAVANVEAFNDGNKYTSAATRSALTAPDDPDWMEAEKYTVGQITFPDLTPIHKIRFFSKDLNRNLSTGMWITVDYLRENGKWRTIKKWTDRSIIPRDPTVNTEVVGKGVRIRIKRPQTLFSGGGPGGGGGSTDNGSRTLYEIEVYKYIPRAEEPAEEPDAEGAM